jgi:hypothetical protein
MAHRGIAKFRVRVLRHILNDENIASLLRSTAASASFASRIPGLAGDGNNSKFTIGKPVAPD